MGTPDILNKIVKTRKERLINEKSDHPLEALLERMESLPEPPSFHNAMVKPGLSIIGEVKKASPSKGVIREDFDPLGHARQYEACVDAISVLTEQDYFKGHPDYLRQIADEVALPLLRKDFIVDAYQIYEARALGASCILLIAAVLETQELIEFQALAGDLQMDALVEVHDAGEMEKALKGNAKIIGINNRNLHTFEVDLATTTKLMAYVPHDVVLISESGINGRDDILTLGSRIQGILVGESFMRAASISEKAKELKAAYGMQG